MTKIQNLNILNKEKIDWKKIQSSALPNKLGIRSPLFQLFADLIAFFISFSIHYYIIFFTDFVASANPPAFIAFIITSFAMSIYWVIIFFFSGLYKNWYIRSPFDELFTLLKVTLFGSIFLALIISMDSYSLRYMFILYFVNIALVTITARTITRRLQKRLREKRIVQVPSIIFGTSDKVIELYEKTLICPAWGFKICGLIFTDKIDDKVKAKIEEYKIPVFNDLKEFDEILNSLKPEEVLIASSNTDHKQLFEVVSKCANYNIIVKIQPDIYNIFTGQTKTLHIYGIPLIEISSQLLKPWQEVIKRIFDIVFSSLVIIIGFPIWFLIGLIIKLETPGTVFYTQPRVGKNGRVFKIYKFRSMFAGDSGQGKWTKVGDPRVTKFGKFTRKSHLDEIPQFWNVLLGDMSIVGPRPEQPKFVEQFTEEISYYPRRHTVRPGITGWWQVKYKPHVLDNEEIVNRLKDDFYYIENMSLKLDIEIIIRTVWAVLKGHGQS